MSTSKELVLKLISLDEVSKRLKNGSYDTGDSTQWGQTRKDLVEFKGILESTIKEDLEARGENSELLIGLANRGEFCPTLYRKLVEE